MKTVYQIMRRRIMFFMTAVLFSFVLFTGCADQTLSDSLSQGQDFITDETDQDHDPYDGENIPAEDGGLYEGDDEADGDEITEQDLYTYVIEDDGAVITGLQEGYEDFWQQSMQKEG